MDGFKNASGHPFIEELASVSQSREVAEALHVVVEDGKLVSGLTSSRVVYLDLMDLDPLMIRGGVADKIECSPNVF